MKSISKKTGIISLIAFAASIAAGLLIPEFCKSIEVLGTVYVNLLKIMMVPVIFTGITSALARDSENMSRITITTILVFIVMFVVLVAAAAGAALSLALSIDFGADLCVGHGVVLGKEHR